MKWDKEFIPEESIAKGDDIPGREDHPHITIKYGIHDEGSEKIKELLKDEPPVKVKLGDISLFHPEGKPYDVVKIDVDSPDLHRLNKKISDNMEVTDTFPDYKPHVTIAYVTKGSGEEFNGSKDFFGKEFTLDTVEFSSKNGDSEKIKLK